MKDETWVMPVECFVGLKDKMYTYITEEDHERKKSIHKNIIDDTLKYEVYKNICHIWDMKRIEFKANIIIGTYRIKKFLCLVTMAKI